MAAILQEISDMPITAQQFSAHAAENPTAVEVQALVNQGYDKAKAEFAPKAATVAELEAAFPGQDSFVLAQLKAGATMAQASVAASKVLGEQLAATKAESTKKDEEIAELKKAKPQAQGPIPGQMNGSDEDRISAERRRELLGKTPAGQAILRREKEQSAAR
jgi:hypothetical protein